MSKDLGRKATEEGFPVGRGQSKTFWGRGEAGGRNRVGTKPQPGECEKFWGEGKTKKRTKSLLNQGSSGRARRRHYPSGKVEGDKTIPEQLLLKEARRWKDRGMGGRGQILR